MDTICLHSPHQQTPFAFRKQKIMLENLMCVENAVCFKTKTKNVNQQHKHKFYTPTWEDKMLFFLKEYLWNLDFFLFTKMSTHFSKADTFPHIPKTSMKQIAEDFTPVIFKYCNWNEKFSVTNYAWREGTSQHNPFSVYVCANTWTQHVRVCVLPTWTVSTNHNVRKVYISQQMQWATSLVTLTPSSGLGFIDETKLNSYPSPN